MEGRFLDEAARLHDVRLIALDRPGYGGSDFKKGRAIGDFAGDVAQLADALDIERFAVVGLSGGGPHAQACAARIPERLTTAVVVSGAGSPDAVLDGRGRIGRFFVKLGLWMAPFFALLSAMWVAFWAPHAKQWMMPRSIDRVVTKRREVREAMTEETREALRPGGRAMAQDLALFARPWDFTPADVGATPVRLFHGDADKVVPVGIGRYYAREIPGCRATFVAGRRPPDVHRSRGRDHGSREGCGPRRLGDPLPRRRSLNRGSVSGRHRIAEREPSPSIAKRRLCALAHPRREGAADHVMPHDARRAIDLVRAEVGDVAANADAIAVSMPVA